MDDDPRGVHETALEGVQAFIDKRPPRWWARTVKSPLPNMPLHGLVDFRLRPRPAD